jgi:hypothetical protein
MEVMRIILKDKKARVGQSDYMSHYVTYATRNEMKWLR